MFEWYEHAIVIIQNFVVKSILCFLSSFIFNTGPEVILALANIIYIITCCLFKHRKRWRLERQMWRWTFWSASNRLMWLNVGFKLQSNLIRPITITVVICHITYFSLFFSRFFYCCNMIPAVYVSTLTRFPLIYQCGFISHTERL